MNMCTQVKQHKSQLDCSHLCIFLTQLTNLRIVPPFPLYFSTLFLLYCFLFFLSKLYTIFLSYCQCPPKEIYGVKFLDQKLLPFATIQFKWYSYRIKICSNAPLQFQLSSTFTMHLPKYIRWEVPWSSEFIQVTLYSVELSTYLHTCITVSYIYCSLFLFLPLDPLIVVFTYSFIQ